MSNQDQTSPGSRIDVGREECPECGSFRTKELKMIFKQKRVVEVRACIECPTRFKNFFEYEKCDPIEDLATVVAS